MTEGIATEGLEDAAAMAALSADGGEGADGALTWAATEDTDARMDRAALTGSVLSVIMVNVGNAVLLSLGFMRRMIKEISV